MAKSEETIQCESCQGSGKVVTGEHFVTHEMAIDAGMPQLEGDHYCFEFAPCPDCHGRGFRIMNPKEADDASKD